MRFDIITIFPEQVEDHLKYGVSRIAESKGLVSYFVHDLRKWTRDVHKSVDDRPYGGGAGMVMRIEPIYEALRELKREESKVVLTTPRGKRLDQSLMRKLTTSDDHYIILCGHYEGFDERVHKHLVDIEVSIGDYILSGGELAALVLVDGMTRLVPGVLGNEQSSIEESFEMGALEYPHYTRPEEFNGWKVPGVLLSGNHARITAWRKAQSEKTTRSNRIDIITETKHAKKS
ncbi:tRNA (guanosine(37)-N1)-methyltransferase TrmD [Candidatus Nomurabacteria bacterium]|nr:tRNA (guanosine(37)-N1)-methyltransferase TrmD [Candidatus Nomurabacteria bacterium]MCB9803700.1 tRNA (guanosine(37)-N1)-methyltransferase TrmD [Candidatus Nomurabacteria bacterium]